MAGFFDKLLSSVAEIEQAMGDSAPADILSQLKDELQVASLCQAPDASLEALIAKAIAVVKDEGRGDLSVEGKSVHEILSALLVAVANGWGDETEAAVGDNLAAVHTVTMPRDGIREVNTVDVPAEVQAPAEAVTNPMVDPDSVSDQDPLSRADANTSRNMPATPDPVLIVPTQEEPPALMDVMSQEDFLAGVPLCQEAAEKLGLVELRATYPATLEILEQAEGHKYPEGVIARARGTLTFGDVINSAGQVYTTELWSQHLPRMQGLARRGNFLANLDHPSDGRPRLQGVAIKWDPDTMRMEGNQFKGEGDVLGTSAGKDLVVMKQAGVQMEFSTRGYGAEYDGKFTYQGEEHDVSFIDKDRFICNGVDVVSCGASAGQGQRPTLELAQAATEPVQVTEEGSQLEERIESLLARLAVLQELGLNVLGQLDPLNGLRLQDEATSGVLDKVEGEVAILEASIAPDELPVKAQVAIDTRFTELGSGDKILVIPLKTLKPSSPDENPFSASPGTDSVEDPAPDGPQGFDEIAPVDTSSLAAGGRMAMFKNSNEPDPRLAVLEQEAANSRAGRIIASEKNEKLKAKLQERLSICKTIEDVVRTADQMQKDWAFYVGDTPETTAKVQGVNQINLNTPFFQRGLQDPMQEPAKTPQEAIDRLVEEVAPKFRPLEKWLGAQSPPDGKFQGITASAPRGQESPKDMLKSFLYQYCLLPSDPFGGGYAPGWGYLQAHRLVEQARWNKSHSEMDDVSRYIVQNLTDQSLQQALATGATSTSQIAAGQSQLLRIISDVYPKLIFPFVGSIQPTNKPTTKVYWERHLGTSATDPASSATELVGVAGSPAGSTPMVRFDQPAYRLWSTQTYAADGGEGVDASPVQYKIESTTISVTAHKLKAEWPFETQQDLLAEHGLDAATQHIGFMGDEIARELNDTILDAMIAAVPAGSTGSFSIGKPATYDNQADWDQKIFTALNGVAMDVSKLRYSKPNIIVAAPNVIERFQQVNKYGTSANPGALSSQLVEGLQPMEGFIPNYMVFNYDRWGRMSSYKNSALLVYRGAKWSSVGVVYVPYTAEVTPIDVNSANFTRKIGFMERSGSSVVNADNFGRLNVAAGTASTDDLIGTG